MIRTEVVLHRLQSIYSLMQSGKLIVPEFQREFAWSKNQIRGLLDSIYRGFPIGTILVLQDQPGRFPIQSTEKSQFPTIEHEDLSKHSSVWYVLDGSQRLAAVYRSFFSDDPRFGFWFHLETEEFVSLKKAQEDPRYVSLRTLYSSDLFRDALADISRMDESDTLIDRLTMLHRAFIDFDVIFQILIDVPLEDAIEIYTRLSASGRRLSRMEIQRIREMSDS